jgi:hypothetical protein
MTVFFAQSCLGVLLLSGPGAGVAEAERLAAESRALLAQDPEAAWQRAQHALDASAVFVATDFVAPGRKDEVLEEAYVTARNAYRRHRAPLYLAAGQALARLGRQAEAARHLRRSLDLGGGEAREPLMAVLMAAGRGWEALAIGLDGAAAGGLGAGRAQQCSVLADALGLPSLQAEVDRSRLAAAAVVPSLGFLDGPFELPIRARLSTGAPLTLVGAEGPTLVYVPESACRTCTADLAALARLAPAHMRVVVAPARQGEDLAVRQALRLYRYDWPVALGFDAEAALRVTAPCVLLVARQGWSGGVARPPLALTLPPLLGVFARSDVQETLPRAGWGRVPPRRPAPVSRPSFTRGELAPGEDAPLPEEFAQAQRAYAAGRFDEALRALVLLGPKGDGWLLAPELRLDQALCLAGLSRREEARAVLRGIGDSRFQEEVDRTLEQLGAAGARR